MIMFSRYNVTTCKSNNVEINPINRSEKAYAQPFFSPAKLSVKPMSDVTGYVMRCGCKRMGCVCILTIVYRFYETIYALEILKYQRVTNKSIYRHSVGKPCLAQTIQRKKRNYKRLTNVF